MKKILNLESRKAGKNRRWAEAAEGNEGWRPWARKRWFVWFQIGTPFQDEIARLSRNNSARWS